MSIFCKLLREAEFKVKNAKKKHDYIMKEFFDCFEHNLNLSDIIVDENDYLSDSDFMNQDDADNEED